MNSNFRAAQQAPRRGRQSKAALDAGFMVIFCNLVLHNSLNFVSVVPTCFIKRAPPDTLCKLK